MATDFLLYDFAWVVEVGCLFWGVVVHEFDVFCGFTVKVEGHGIIHCISFHGKALVKIKQYAFGQCW